MRRDLELGVDPAALVLSPPDRSELREMFRRFEFRGLLNRIDDLDVAVPAAEPVRVAGDRGRLARGHLARGARPGRPRDRRRPLRARRRQRRRGRPLGAGARGDSCASAEVVAHDAKALRLAVPARRRHDDRRLPDRAGPRLLRARRPRGRVRRRGDARSRRPRRRPTALVRRAEVPRRLAAPMRERLAERGSTELYESIELPLVTRARRDGGRRRQDRHLPDGRDHGAPRRERSRSSSRARTSSRARSSCSARPSRSRGSCSRSSQLTPGPQGQDRLLDRHARPARRSATSTRSSP